MTHFATVHLASRRPLKWRLCIDWQQDGRQEQPTNSSNSNGCEWDHQQVLNVCANNTLRMNFQTYRCPRMNVPDFGRVFLMLNYTEITQNTYVQSWTVTEIMAREKCGLLAGPRTVPVSWQPYLCYFVECGVIWRQSTHASPKLRIYFLQGDDVVSHVMSVLGIPVSCIVLGTLRTTMTWVRVFL